MIIGISGYANAGKDTIADYIADNFNFTKRAFANALRAHIYKVNVYFPEYNMRYRDLLDIAGGYDNAKRNYPAIREYMVTEAESLCTYAHSDIWVDTVFKDPIPQRLVISDLRKLNEETRIKSANGITIHIVKDGVEPANDNERDSIAQLTPDYIIYNDDNVFTNISNLLSLVMNK